MTNWETYISDYFANHTIEFIDRNEYSNSFELVYYNNGVYISFDLIKDSRKINKVEFGTYVQSNEGVKPNNLNFIKGILDTTKPHNIDFIQDSYYGISGSKYELIFNKESQKTLLSFLKFPCHIGWKEELYKFKEKSYKVKIYLKVRDEANFTYEVLLMDYAEQDIPLPGDKLTRQLTKFIYDMRMNSEKRVVSTEKTSGLLKK